VSRRGRRQLPVGLARRQLGQENSKSVAIFISYPNLSMSNLPDKSRPGWRLSSPTIGGLFRPAIQLSQTIGRAVYASPAAIQHVRVDHGSRHICVTQKLLDRADVVAIFKQVRGKRMAQGIIILLTNSLPKRSTTDIIPFTERKSKWCASCAALTRKVL